MSESTAAEPAKITPRHYQALCGLALAAVALVQYQHSSRVATNLPIVYVILPLVVFVGTVGIAFRVRISPMLVLATMALPQGIEQVSAGQNFNPFRAMRVLDVRDMVVCMAALAYFIGYYRLHGLWFGVLPLDARQAGQKDAPPKVRTEDSLRPAELFALVLTVPGFALAAQVACLVLKQRWELIDLPFNWKQFLFVTWTVLLALCLGAQAFSYWRRLQMNRATALLMLQDILWNETRGEQRRINRWLAWRRLLFSDDSQKRGEDASAKRR